jgi:hypothetical protein
VFLRGATSAWCAQVVDFKDGVRTRVVYRSFKEEEQAARAVDDALDNMRGERPNARLLDKLARLKACGYYDTAGASSSRRLPAGVSELEANALRPCS